MENVDDFQYLDAEESEDFQGEVVEVQEEEEDLDYQETLNYSQRIRRRIVNDRMSKGVPEDDDSVKLVLTALKDMDKTAVDRRRNEIDADSGDTAREVAHAMREFLTMQGNTNPFEGGGDTPRLPPEVTEEELGEFDIPQGEFEQGIIEETSEEFTSRMNQQADVKDGK